MNTQVIWLEKKVNLIFSYLFSTDKSIEEEDFWNKLSKKEFSKLEKIDKEEVSDFNLLKSNILWK